MFERVFRKDNPLFYFQHVLFLRGNDLLKMFGGRQKLMSPDFLISLLGTESASQSPSANQSKKLVEFLFLPNALKRRRSVQCEGKEVYSSWTL